MRERSPGYWQLRVFEGSPSHSKKRYRTHYMRGGKRVAQKQLALLVTEVDGGVAPTAKTDTALLDEWLAHIEHLGRSPSRLLGYRRLVAQLPEASSRFSSRR